ncbi:MAG: fructose-bisphosphatase class III [Ruminococcaceae bacterium]|jgi:serine/threonine protein phosphatase 1|nr:fructose-bisphosphatase class III [Oscillospiraceae bacterium]
MTYAVSDIHGCCDTWLQALDVIRFSDDDTLYVLGDMVDRGPAPIRLLQDMMARPNVIPLLGNHEYMAATVLQKLLVEVTADNVASHLTADDLRGCAIWIANGGQTTLEELRRLPRKAQRDVLDYLVECSLCEEITAGGHDYVLVHAGFSPYVPGRSPADYGPEATLFTPPEEGRVYFPGRWLVTGHIPTAAGRIFRKGNHLSIDCGCVFGGHLAVLRLEDQQVFYIPGPQGVR